MLGGEVEEAEIRAFGELVGRVEGLFEWVGVDVAMGVLGVLLRRS
jgi:hypothetical protein